MRLAIGRFDSVKMLFVLILIRRFSIVFIGILVGIFMERDKFVL